MLESPGPTLRLVILLLSTILAPTLALSETDLSVASETLWILGAQRVDVDLGDSSQEVDVALRGDRIVAVLQAGLIQPPKGAAVVDGTGLWLAPGAFDSHVHVSSTPALLSQDTPELRALETAYRNQAGRSFLLHGFTQVVDLNHRDEGSIAWFRENGPAPDLLHVGTALTMAGGYPLNWVPEDERWSYSNYLLDPLHPVPNQPAGVDPTQHTPEATVARVESSGGVAVKLFWEKGFGGFSNLPTPSRPLLEQVVATAHQRGLPVVVHANSFEAWDFVTQSPIDALVHGMWNWDQHRGSAGLPAEISQVVDRAIDREIALMPTTRVLGGLRDLFDPTFLSDPRLAEVYPPAFLDYLQAGGGGGLRDEIRREDFDDSPDDAMIRRQMEAGRGQGDRVLQAFVARGGNFVFGSDTPSGPFYTNPPGLNGRLELQHLATLGIDPLAIARALTLAPAKLFGVAHEYGEVAVGRKANLLLLRSDPLQSALAWGEIERVIVSGTVLQPVDLAAAR